MVFLLPLVMFTRVPSSDTDTSRRIDRCQKEARILIYGGKLEQMLGKPRVLLAPTDLGGEILFWTPESIVASNYPPRRPRHPLRLGRQRRHQRKGDAPLPRPPPHPGPADLPELDRRQRQLPRRITERQTQAPRMAHAPALQERRAPRRQAGGFPGEAAVETVIASDNGAKQSSRRGCKNWIASSLRSSQ
ncbi:MAG: hypothetical protein WDN72_03445 [Alphaproteobacteria bacterium]